MSDRYVKVTAVLASPLAGQDAPALDSLCEFAMSYKAKSIQESKNGDRHQYEVAVRGQPVALDAVGKLPIPIARKRCDGLPIPRCSSPILGGIESDHAAHYTTAFPIHKSERLLESERTKISQGGGRFKSFRLPIRLRLTPCVVWFAVLRDRPSRLRQLLNQIRFLGKKSAHGHGLISEWRIETIESDLSWYAPSPEGTVLMRRLPIEMNHPDDLIGFRKSYGGCVGPYWQRDFWREIYEPC